MRWMLWMRDVLSGWGNLRSCEMAIIKNAEDAVVSDYVVLGRTSLKSAASRGLKVWEVRMR